MVRSGFEGRQCLLQLLIIYIPVFGWWLLFFMCSLDLVQWVPEEETGSQSSLPPSAFASPALGQGKENVAHAGPFPTWLCQAQPGVAPGIGTTSTGQLSRLPLSTPCASGDLEGTNPATSEQFYFRKLFFLKKKKCDDICDIYDI